MRDKPVERRWLEAEMGRVIEDNIDIREDGSCDLIRCSRAVVERLVSLGFSIQVDRELWKKLNEIAENEKRALNDVIGSALRRYVQAKS